jgi:hypothetical protein
MNKKNIIMQFICPNCKKPIPYNKKANRPKEEYLFQSGKHHWWPKIVIKMLHSMQNLRQSKSGKIPRCPFCGYKHKAPKIRQQKVLSKNLLSLAFIARNGELCWKKENIPEVIKEFSILGYWVESFEVWIINDENKTWTGLFPVIGEKQLNLFVYDVKPKAKDENQADYHKRANEEILNEIENCHIENIIIPELVLRVRYNLYLPNLRG